MTADEWAYLRRMAAGQGVTLKDAGVNRKMRLGYAMDCVFEAAEKLAS